MVPVASRFDLWTKTLLLQPMPIRTSLRLEGVLPLKPHALLLLLSNSFQFRSTVISYRHCCLWYLHETNQQFHTMVCTYVCFQTYCISKTYQNIFVLAEKLLVIFQSRLKVCVIQNVFNKVCITLRWTTEAISIQDNTSLLWTATDLC